MTECQHTRFVNTTGNGPPPPLAVNLLPFCTRCGERLIDGVIADD